MSTPSAPSSTNDRITSPDGSAHAHRRRLVWITAGTFAVVTFALWIYALFVYDPGLLIDELEDRSFPRAAEQVCTRALEQLDGLPRAETSGSPLERAGTIDRADAILTAMVAELRPIAPEEPASAAEAVEEWLDDWQTHIQDRQDYADRLREDPEARFTETAKGSKQVSRAIDGYAQVNRMRSCETPGDVG